ncbi:hypothetical protein PNOK_0212800 [Pyrrhoderma noxium]|uniref:Uncharacterized protein n=1 Tax=Pyrrhoderma noxium TaxID=2282107 RepID=A0A286URG1_9AGAM|nr:hypothetical protein PNOK_0212800 [Pyrrhoderma noxium]
MIDNSTSTQASVQVRALSYGVSRVHLHATEYSPCSDGHDPHGSPIDSPLSVSFPIYSSHSGVSSPLGQEAKDCMSDRESDSPPDLSSAMSSTETEEGSNSQITSSEPKPQKRGSRRIWTHALERYIFTPHEIATLGTPHRRTIYLASLEAHIDRLHSQVLVHGLSLCHDEELEQFQGLNCKIAKGLVSGLQQDVVRIRTQILELQRSIKSAQEIAAARGLDLSRPDSDGRSYSRLMDSQFETHK